MEGLGETRWVASVLVMHTTWKKSVLKIIIKRPTRVCGGGVSDGPVILAVFCKRYLGKIDG